MTARERLAAVLARELLEGLEELIEETVSARLAGLERDGSKRWLTPREAGEYLGCSERAVYARIRRGRIPEDAVKRSGRSMVLDRFVLDRNLSKS